VGLAVPDAPAEPDLPEAPAPLVAEPPVELPPEAMALHPGSVGSTKQPISSSCPTLMQPTAQIATKSAQ
jgi:hypothetical protein